MVQERTVPVFHAAPASISREEGLLLYEDMILGRFFEDKCAEMYYRGKMFGFVHLYNGQEAISTGVIKAMRPRQTDAGLAGSGVSEDARAPGVMVAGIVSPATVGVVTRSDVGVDPPPQPRRRHKAKTRSKWRATFLSPRIIEFGGVWYPRDNDRALRAGQVGSSLSLCCTVR